MDKKSAVFGRDRIAIVTGGSSGIGLAVGKLLAQKGSHVWLVARQQERLAAALEEVKAIRQSPEQKCGATPADVSDPAQALAVVEQVTKEVGVPHLLVNSAGVARPGYFHDMELQDFHWMMDINYFGTVNMVKAVLPGMIERHSGHIVNISSGAGFMGIFGYSAYGASKYAVSGFSEIIRAELKPHGIGVSVVFPPDVDTPQLAYESQFRPPETRSIVDGGPILSPDSVATTILRAVNQGKYLILPGVMIKILYPLTNLLGTNITHRAMDFLIAHQQRQENKTS